MGDRLLGQRVADLWNELNALFLLRALVPERGVLPPRLRLVICNARGNGVVALQFASRRPQ
ncbi:MAG: hypothetical protein ACYC9Z_15075 [Casimicrobiaceae bacterium]